MATVALTMTPTTAPTSSTSVAHTRRTTFYDMIVYVRDFMGADSSAEADRTAKRAIQAAMREVANAHNWAYYYTQGRLNANASYSTGTVTGDVTGGAYENMLTIATGTWPTWAANGTVLISDVQYPVDRRISSTIITLDSTLAPVSDIAASTTFEIFQDAYSMPEDFVAGDNGLAEVSWGEMQYVHPADWLRLTRNTSGASTPRWYTFMTNTKTPGRLTMRVFPYPNESRTIDFVYKRRPRKLSLESYTTGTVSSDSVTATTTLTGTGTVWTSAMEGCVIRLADDALTLPTDLSGANPFALERNLKTFSSSTVFLVDDAADSTLSAVVYRISDPIDVEDGVMLEVFYRCCEKHAAMLRNMKNKADFAQQYDQALLRAKEADSRSFAPKSAGSRGSYRQRLADMPRGDDVD